ncbi:hypothetical protein HAX54_030466 [Datura stramonium]|uniref:Uncharacterized protein n=1 Tax=Datura stramonium TaxID=4076 RepID=A0ABS8SAZ6_DATST|nr:hypothetical protein [Datura stramonium]
MLSKAARSGQLGERMALSGLMAHWTKQGEARSDLVALWMEHGVAHFSGRSSIGAVMRLCGGGVLQEFMA